jgi:hypothetical protein
MIEKQKYEEIEREEVSKVISMCASGMITLQRDHLVATIFSRETTY